MREAYLRDDGSLQVPYQPTSGSKSTRTAQLSDCRHQVHPWHRKALPAATLLACGESTFVIFSALNLLIERTHTDPCHAQGLNRHLPKASVGG